MKALVAALLSPCVAAAVLAQQPPAPSFDAVSIKVNRSGAQGGTSRAQPGRYVGINVTLMRLVRLAYRPISEFDGGPTGKTTPTSTWRTATSANPSQAEMLAMMRAMLADRFKLRAHVETRQLPIYELVVARPDGRLGPALVRVADACPPPTPPGAPPTQDGAGLPADAPPEIFTAIREQLGLRARAGTAPSEVLVIDSAERPDET